MKYLSLDIETTGLDFEKHQILSIGAAIDDLEKPLAKAPTFYTEISYEVIVGDPYSLSMHPDLLARISKRSSNSYGLTEALYALDVCKAIRHKFNLSY